MTAVNKYGLSRDIPNPIKREVRQRCGFGCINCGRALYQYEHVDPEFAEARTHDADCIVLLCGGCHDLVTRGMLSKETIKAKALNPKCREIGFSFGPFDIGNQPPDIVFGTITARNCRTFLRLAGDDVFSIVAPAEGGQPFILNARFFDINGAAILDIVENEWKSSIHNWDVEVVGQRIKIRKAAANFALILRSEPPRRIVIERMDMLHKGIRVECSEETTFQVITPDGGIIKGMGLPIDSENWDVGIDASETGFTVGYNGMMHTGSRAPGGPTAALMIKAGPVLRNAPCPCGSGLKFKKCHGRLV